MHTILSASRVGVVDEGIIFGSLQRGLSTRSNRLPRALGHALGAWPIHHASGSRDRARRTLGDVGEVLGHGAIVAR
jgi:hypothetical protein